MRRLTFLAFVVGLIAMAVPSIAQVPLTVVLEGFYEGPTDTVQLIETVNVDPGLVGATCTGTGTIVNNASVHPDNDLIISTGGESAEVTDYESVPGATFTFDGNEAVVLGETIDFSVRFGGHAQTSLGVSITLDCAPLATTTTTTTTTTTEAPPETTTTAPPETTTTAAPGTTTTAAPETTTTTTPPETTTTSSAPLGGVGAGAGGAADSDALAWFALGAASLILAGTGATAAWRMRDNA